ncbi:MAG: cytochrome c peroxidase [Pseudomonadota bacterium]
MICGAQQLPPAVQDSDYLPVNLKEARLGQLLFYDPILSGNKTVACATCHHPKFGTGDGVALSFGDGGIGLGPERRADPDNMPEERIPRNAPALFNLGAREFTVMFHDGRLEADPNYPGGIRTPMDADMMAGFTSVLAAQTMFPVLSRDEMAGSYDENPIAARVRQGRITGKDGAWDLLAGRVAQIPAYETAFSSLYPHIDSGSDITFVDISNAIAAFMAHEWRSDAAPFDAMLRGETAFEGQEAQGLALFYGKAGCAACHSGPFLTDHKFHAMGVPQIGPGKSALFEDHHRDEGRFRVTGRPEDLYAFRTPSLRNVALTAPYGHAGAQADLTDFVASHADPVPSLLAFRPDADLLPDYAAADFEVMSDPEQWAAIASAVTSAPKALSETEIADIVSFLQTLTDPTSIDGRLGVPDTVPSGLPVP